MGAAICASLIEEKNIGEIYGFHNLPGYHCGEVVLLNHTFACASTGLEIKFQGKQSHAAYPENGRNPANAITQGLSVEISCVEEFPATINPIKTRNIVNIQESGKA